MPNNWTETLRRRRAGDVEGFNGADVPHEQRGRRPPPDATPAAPAKKAPAKKARRSTKKSG